MGRFSSKRIIVTGGTSGIGLAGAERLAAEGAEVFITGRKEPTSGRLSDSVHFVRNDATDPDAGKELLQALPDEGGFDGLWLNAGFAEVAPLSEIDAVFFDRMMHTNVRGPVLQMSALCDRLNDDASVVVTSSTAIHEGSPNASIYAATKGALVSLCRCWASALGPRGIRVNALVPGAIATGFRDFMPKDFRSAFEADVVGRTVLGRVGAPGDAAAVALFLLSDEAAYVTGSQYLVDGGLTMA
ncbi:SDR family oxidoreductase [Mesorhizobium retamae]|uniref:SDR family oxidoreductase n=1 Tax=Mesorhizobium retamae TaxID=2912854 RepID=A0ABS9QK10_9HYPH|nr:SDR family oxidoreductase [Mesorhizobium sp. IRAMC:0171]MCG7507762.1 SDR family oxidoreductase [Mesorhizobium sp. IRAMC:0171]